MQVTYQQSFDDWVAGQIFGVEQLSLPQKQSKKIFFLIFLIVFDVYVFFTSGADPWFWFFTLVIAWYGYFLWRARFGQQKMLYRYLLRVYGQKFEKEEEKTVTWDVSPECIRLARPNRTETRFQWEAIRRIVVCPDYLFIDFGGVTGWASFPGGAVPETVYQAFCEEVIRTYREHAARAGKIADVIHSEWAIDFEKLKKRIWR